MRRVLALLAVAAVAACSSLPDAGSGVVALEIQAPDTTGGVAGCPAPTNCVIPNGDTLTLRARALNLHGDSVAAAVVWSTPDTILISLDAVRGVITARLDTSATARVQASVGTLRSSVISIQLQRDTATSSGLRARQ